MNRSQAGKEGEKEDLKLRDSYRPKEEEPRVSSELKESPATI